MTEPQELDGFDPHTHWVNYGDVNPEPHGGIFVKYDPDWGSWELVRTVKLADVMAEEPADSNRQMVDVLAVDHDDVFVEGDPSKGLTDRMMSVLESLQREHLAPRNADPDLPKDADHNYGYAPDFLEDISYYVADYIYHVGGRSDIKECEDYDELIAGYGVTSFE